MRGIFLMALNDLRQTIKDRPSLFWMIIMPVGFVFLFGQLGGHSRAAQIALTLVDQDQSLYSKAFADALGRQGFAVKAAEAAALDTLDIRRGITIPAGFGDSLAAGEKAPVYYYVNPDADAEASVVGEMHLMRASLSTLITLSAATSKVTGGAGDATHGADASEARTSRARERDTSRRSAAGAFRLSDSLLAARIASIAAQPPKITVSAETAGRGRPVPSGMRQSLPATLTLFILINATIYGAVFLATEKQERILARLSAQPLTRLQILSGKLLGSMLIGLVQAIILLLAGRFLMNAYVGNSIPGLLTLIFCLALVSASLALFWGAVLNRPEQVTATTLVVSLFLGAIGGCWWPLEIVPKWMQAVGHISPAAWAMDGLHALISFGAGFSGVLLPCAVLLGYAAVFLALGATLLKFEG